MMNCRKFKKAKRGRGDGRGRGRLAGRVGLMVFGTEKWRRGGHRGVLCNQRKVDLGWGPKTRSRERSSIERYKFLWVECKVRGKGWGAKGFGSPRPASTLDLSGVVPGRTSKKLLWGLGTSKKAGDGMGMKRVSGRL